MNNKLLFLTAAFFITNASAVYAADFVYDAPEAPIYDEAVRWGGGYIGGQAGYSWARSRLSFDHINNALKARPSGFIGGIYAGYNWELSNAYLLGVEGDINYADLSRTAVRTGPLQEISFTPRVQLEAAVRARFGVGYGRWLPFIAGGVGIARVKDTFNVRRPQTLLTVEQTDTRVGFTVGMGVDYALTNNLMFRAEYRYNNYGRKYISGSENGVRSKLTENNVRLGIAYKF